MSLKDYSRRLTGKIRTKDANSSLAYFLTFIAGAINAGGFLAIGQYTSHMSGIVSGMADSLALWQWSIVLSGLGALMAFIAGAATTALIINWARHSYLQSEYALPILLEALMLIVFGALDGMQWYYDWLWTSVTVAVLCYIMGLQNAIMTKMSRSEFRTTHVTGMVTDIGIELGKLFYWNRSHDDPKKPPVKSDRAKLFLLSKLVCLFFLGGLIGAFGFKHLGFTFTVFLASILVLVASAPVLDDLHAAKVLLKRRRRTSQAHEPTRQPD
ncbi:MAG: DUF1275 domain-containing protein [Alcaligenaceae bacterium]|nr:DUF1275 domain-containing protein [Alcaligenaceae bacterium]